MKNLFSNITGCIFDVDGTLLDSMGVWSDCANIFLKSKGIDAPSLEKKFFSFTLDMACEYMKKTFALEQSEEEIAEEIMRIIRDFYYNEAQLRPGAREVLEMFAQKNIPMVIVSSGKVELIDAAFTRLGIRHFFRKIITGSKNTNDIFFFALGLLGTKKENTFVFEDALFACEIAKKAGFKVCAINDPKSKQDKSALKQVADIFLENWNELFL